MSLSPRLKAIASLVPMGARLGDVGSDHGELPIYLVKAGAISRAVAIENKKGPFSRLRKGIEEASLSEEIEVSLSDGVSSLPNDIDAIVLAGMGGGLIERILTKDEGKLANVNAIIIEPQGEKEKALGALFALGYSPKKEICLFEGEHYYECFLFKKGRSPAFSLPNLRFGALGEVTGKESYFKNLENEIFRLKAILGSNSLPNTVKDRYDADIKEMEKILNEH